MAAQNHETPPDTESNEDSTLHGSLSPTEEKVEVPNEGAQAWIQVLGSFFFYFNSWGLLNTFGTFEAYYLTKIPRTASEVSWIGTVEGFLLLCVGIIAGSLHDKGYFRWLVTFGSFMVVFGLMMVSLTKVYWQVFLAHGICLGIGTACLYLPSLSIVATYFHKRRGLAIGICIAGGQLGGVIYPIVFNQLEPKLGFGWAIRIIGFIALGLLAFSNSIMRPRVAPKAKGEPLLDVTAFKEPHYVLFTFGLFVTLIGLYLPWYFGPTYGGVVLGMTTDQSFYLTAITNGASIAGAIASSVIADKVGPLNLMIPCTFITGALHFAWIGVRTIPGFQVYVAFYGFFTGALITLPNQVLAYLSPSLQQIGTRIGMCYSIAAFGLLIGSPTGGALLDITTANFLKLQIYGAVMLCAGAALFSLAGLLFYRQKRTA